MVDLRASQMRPYSFIFLFAVIAVGCNADPRCRRETALLRAEILDLEDKLALANAGETYDGGFISSSDEIIISEPTIELHTPDVIYESDAVYSTSSTHSSRPLEVQHQIFPNEATGSSAIHLHQNASVDSLNIENESPSLGADTKSIRPNRSRTFTPNVPGAKLTPAHGSQNQKTRRRSPSVQEHEITLAAPSPEPEITQLAEPISQITEIVVNRAASSGENVDGKSGDEGLNLLIQPRTADGSILLEAGSLSVDLIDPSANSNRRRIGHWEFVPSETELFFARDEKEGHGILLHLPWEKNLPSKGQLLVSVSFITADGRTLQTSSRLSVDPPTPSYSPNDPLVTGWTQRDIRWEIGTHNQSVSAHASEWVESRSGLRGLPSLSFAQDSSPNAQRIKRRVKAIPASTQKIIQERPLPTWRPVR